MDQFKGLRPAPNGTFPLIRITAKLAGIEREHGVIIPVAIESGSRAWGFPSPDSDYDCRFIYVRPVEGYMSLWPKRDVIELPLDGDFDISGWDLAKALKLILRGNAAAIEWLTSPTAYRVDAVFRDNLLAFATRFANRTLNERYYLNLGEQQRRAHFANQDAFAHKKIFYALRPAAALRWLRMYPDGGFAPADFPTAWAAIDAPEDVSEIDADLMMRKSRGRDLGAGPLPKPVSDFIDAEFDLAQERLAGVKSELSAEALAAADALLLAYARRVSQEQAAG